MLRELQVLSEIAQHAGSSETVDHFARTVLDAMARPHACSWIEVPCLLSMRCIGPPSHIVGYNSTSKVRDVVAALEKHSRHNGGNCMYWLECLCVNHNEAACIGDPIIPTGLLGSCSRMEFRRMQVHADCDSYYGVTWMD